MLVIQEQVYIYLSPQSTCFRKTIRGQEVKGLCPHPQVGWDEKIRQYLFCAETSHSHRAINR